MTYADFLARKARRVPPAGLACDPGDVHTDLHDWQRELTAEAVRRGRAALWWSTGLGKALDSDTNVITPDGMRRIGDLRPGEFVMGANGQPTEVLGVYPQGQRPGYRVTFSDDASIVCDDEHLWTVRTKSDKHKRRDWRVLTLREIREKGTGGPGDERSGRWFIPMVNPVEFAEGDLPMHPYLLGCLLGDGYIKKEAPPSISSADDDLIDSLRELLPLGMDLVKRRYAKYDYDFVRTGRLAGLNGGHHKNPLTSILKELGVHGHGAESKFVPDVYKFAAPDTRMSVLQGLMDTDGSVWDSHGCSVLEYCTVSPRLAEDFVFLVQSLGGRGRIRTRQTNGRLAYRITPALPPGMTPFLLKRKVDRFKPRTKYPPARSIREVETVGERDMTCIKVAAEDELFVVEGFVVTHNTRAQLEWARLSGKRALIVAPLAVCHQTVAEAEKIDLEAAYVREGDGLGPGVYVTNYEMIHRFSPESFDCVVIDEASCLKHHDAKIRAQLIETFRSVPHRLVATATPAPNDPAELTGQAEFLGLMSRQEMLASYFINDAKTGGKNWRLKGHARGPMFDWMAGWASALRSPADVGFPDEAYRLPPLHIHTHLIPTGGAVRTEGTLFDVPGAVALKGVQGRAAVRKATLEARCGFAVDLVMDEPDEPWILWAGLNAEAELLADSLPAAVNVHGAMSPEEKAEHLLAFARGEIPVLVTKPSIASFGMNWQHCSRQAFVGLSDSFEQYFQCVRRSWRYGQRDDVHAHIVLTDIEAPIAENVHRKEREAAALIDELVTAVNTTRNRRAA